MVKGKSIREKGKIRFSQYFQKLKKGDNVALVKEKSLTCSFPDRMQGRTGRIIGKQGKEYIINVKDHAKDKEFVVHPIHLKKIKMIKKNDKK